MRLPLSGGTEAGRRYKLPSASAASSFFSLLRKASDVIKHAGVKINPFLPPPRLQAAFPVKTTTSPSLCCQQGRKVNQPILLTWTLMGHSIILHSDGAPHKLNKINHTTISVLE